MCSPQIGVAAAIIAALPPLGIDVRFFGRPNVPLEGIPYFRARQAQRAIVVALISLGVSVGAFYYFFRPRVVEKFVEKPVEKLVPAPCPEPQVPSAKPIVGKVTQDKQRREYLLPYSSTADTILRRRKLRPIVRTNGRNNSGADQSPWIACSATSSKCYRHSAQE